MYKSIAEYYDLLMADTDYDSIVNDICVQFEKAGNIKTVVDIGCGTGTISTKLAKLGYDVIGLDLSEEMLAVADNKSRKEGLSIRYSCQDMSCFDVGRKADAVICILDGINHLKNKNKVISCFTSVKKCLRDGGLFIFDINSPHKFENVFGVNDFVLEQDGVLCAWSNYYDRDSRKCDFQLSVFAKSKNNLYHRVDEVQTEYCYTKKEIMQFLLLSGMQATETVNVPLGSDNANSERIIFVAK